MKKQIVLLVLLLFAIIVPMFAVYANETAIPIIVEGRRQGFMGIGNPVIIDGRVLVSLQVFGALGLTREFDSGGAIVLSNDEHTVIVEPYSYTVTINGRAHNLDVAARMIDGHYMLPLRQIAEEIGFYVNWTERNRIVRISAAPFEVPYMPYSIADLRAGQLIPFGKYVWRVLDIQGDYAFIITEDSVENRAFHLPSAEGVTWAASSLRHYLNNEFLYNFSEAELARIRETMVESTVNPWFGTHGGDNTTDKIFLLSLDEVLYYFGDSGWVAEGTDPRRRRRVVSGFPGPSYGIYSCTVRDRYDSARIALSASGWNSSWWLRTPGGAQHFAVSVGSHGELNILGSYMHYSRSTQTCGVRPVLWLRFG